MLFRKRAKAPTEHQAEREPLEIFGGTDPAELAEVIGGGFATWVDTDGSDGAIVATHGAMVARAPLDVAYATVSDFENTHRFVGVSRRNKVHTRNGRRVEIELRQGIGLGPFKLGLSERFRFRFEPPDAVRCEAYLDGPFSDAELEWRLVALDSERTLMVLSFRADVTQLGGLIRKFFDRQPELGFTVSGHVVIVPLTSYAEEAERRAGARADGSRPVARPVPESLAEGKMRPALEHGYLTVGRLDDDGEIVDIACATRIGASREEVWPAIVDPKVLGTFISFISETELRDNEPGEVTQRLEYTIRFGPLKKRYTYVRHAEVDKPSSARTIHANLDGTPALQDEVLWDDRGDTLLCQVHRFDLKADWLSALFLRGHPEFERLIATYSPSVFVRSVRRLMGPPRTE